MTAANMDYWLKALASRSTCFGTNGGLRAACLRPRKREQFCCQNADHRPARQGTRLASGKANALPSWVAGNDGYQGYEPEQSQRVGSFFFGQRGRWPSRWDRLLPLTLLRVA